MLRLTFLLISLATLTGCFKSDPNQSVYDSCSSGLDKALLQWGKYPKWDLSNLEFSNILFKTDTVRNQKYETDQFVLFNVIMKSVPLEDKRGKKVVKQIICSGYASKSPNEISADKSSLSFNVEGVEI